MEVISGEVLRQAMLVRGVKLNEPLAKRFDDKGVGNCRATGLLCTTCAVSVLQGGELLNPMRMMPDDDAFWHRAIAVTMYNKASQSRQLTEVHTTVSLVPWTLKSQRILNSTLQTIQRFHFSLPAGRLTSSRVLAKFPRLLSSMARHRRIIVEPD